MPSIECPSISVAVTGATATGTLTVTTSENIFPGARGSLIKTGAPTVCEEVQVVELVDATHIKVRVLKAPVVIDGYPAGQNYGYSDVSTFNAGATFTQHRTLVPVEPDYISVFRV